MFSRLATWVALATAASVIGGRAVPALVQGSGLAPEAYRRHSAAVRSERIAAFFERWQAADAAARARVANALAELRPEGAQLDQRPSDVDLALAGAVLAGSDLQEARSDELARFAESLDLLVVPGVVDAASTGLGAQVTARVYRYFPTSFREAVELSLVWRDANGAETVARREPFRPEDFDRGFPVFVRAPTSGEGLWQLVPVVHVGERSARGVGVAVELVPDASSRLERWSGLESNQLFLRRLRELHELGIRSADAFAPSQTLDLLEGRAVGQSYLPADSLPKTDPPTEARGPGPQEREEDTIALVIVTPQGEGGAITFGPVGRAWQNVMEQRELDLCAFPVESVASDSFASAIGQLSALPSITAVVAVVGGEDVAPFSLALASGDVKFDGIVLASSAPAPGPALPDVPTLFVTTNEAASEDPEHVERVVRGQDLFLVEPDLPALVLDWLERVFPQ